MIDDIRSELETRMKNYGLLSKEDREETTKTCLVVIAGGNQSYDQKTMAIYQLITLFCKFEGNDAGTIDRISDILVESIDDAGLLRAIADNIELRGTIH